MTRAQLADLVVRAVENGSIRTSFALALAEEVKERLDAGLSHDCDAYRALLAHATRRPPAQEVDPCLNA